MSGVTLNVDIVQFWHCGAGRGGGAVLDQRVHRGADGLPRVPGRHLKGLLRHALESAESWQWSGFDGLAAVLFGDRTEEDAIHPPRPGCLRVSDACLPPAIAGWLSGSSEGRSLASGLFRSLHATAIDPDTSSAKAHSLRGIEVVVPLRLVARIEPIAGREPPRGWLARLGEAVPAVTAVGAHRSRGLGRARLSVGEAT